ncbi:S9 family peptidase, partial [Myxococcota bacterium]|nr:S9 family peptidase [Myxococcota bacterium]
MKYLSTVLAALFVVTLFGCTKTSETTSPDSTATVVSKENAALTYPETLKKPVSDTFHGQTVTEDYRWLESWDDAAVKKWSAAEDKVARSYLDALPTASALRKRFETLLKADTENFYAIQYAGGLYFAEQAAPPKQQALLVVTNDLFNRDAVRVILDPNVLDKSGATTIDWYAPSNDGKLVAVSLSKGGSEVGDLHIYEVETGKEVFEVVPRVNTGTAGGHLAWAHDNKGFYYTRHPRGTERKKEDMNFYQQLFFHKLGTVTESDRYELGKDFPRIAETEVSVEPGTGRVLCTVQNGDGGEFAHYLKDAKGKWNSLSVFGDRVVQIVFGAEEDLFIISRADAPRGKLLHLARGTLDTKKAKELIPQQKDTLVSSFWGASSIAVAKSRIYLTYQLGGPSEIRSFDFTGKALSAPTQLPVSAVSNLEVLDGDGLLFSNRSYVNPSALYLFSALNGETRKTALKQKTIASYANVEVVREFATSK